MTFEVSERIHTNADLGTVLSSLEEQFRKVASKVTRQGDSLDVRSIEASLVTRAQTRGEGDPTYAPRASVHAAPRGTHETTLDVRCVPGWGHELVLSLDGEWKRSRTYRREQPLAIIDAIGETVARLEAKG